MVSEPFRGAEMYFLALQHAYIKSAILYQNCAYFCFLTCCLDPFGGAEKNWPSDILCALYAISMHAFFGLQTWFLESILRSA